MWHGSVVKHRHKTRASEEKKKKRKTDERAFVDTQYVVHVVAQGKLMLFHFCLTSAGTTTISHLQNESQQTVLLFTNQDFVMYNDKAKHVTKTTCVIFSLELAHMISKAVSRLCVSVNNCTTITKWSDDILCVRECR